MLLIPGSKGQRGSQRFRKGFWRPTGLLSAGSTGSGQEEVQHRDEEAPADEHHARRLNRFGALVTHIFGHIGDRVQQSVERQTDLDHLRAGIVCSMFLCIAT